MKFHIVFVTADEYLAKYVSKKKTGIIPRDVSRHGCFGGPKSTVSVSSYLVPPNGNAPDLRTFLTPVMYTADGIVLVCDDVLENVVDSLKDAMFCAPITRGYEGMTLHNYLNRFLSRVLKNFSAFAVKFADGKYQKVLLLPLNNFSAPDLNELRNAFSALAGENQFSDTLTTLLARLRDRQRPKSSDDYPNTYLLDDRRHFYVYGPERHAKADTKSPPHSFRCKINGFFRFGLRYDEARHFNVSLENRREHISGNFIDCHDASRHVHPCSHVDLFPNGFF